ncbi:enhancer of mRNA-decapping protein 4 [Pleurodeles waltl]|uniref:enhancer of mRNA-decapping protein 4 n=1 Tax=Pleurodeles waltl TaxID=8319 RepID=UPI0037096797
MDPSGSIDISATRHLRDILKLDRPGDSPNEDPRNPSSSYNGDLNGLLSLDPLGAGDSSSLSNVNLLNVPMKNVQDKQVICLSGDDSSTCVLIVAKDVEIVASKDSSISSKARGSNKVKIQPVAKYDWEQKYYYGNLIAVSNSYLAYATRGANGSAMVRVLSVTTAERILLKGIMGSVTDLAFAHLNSSLLACLDEVGNLFVWHLSMENGKIQDEIWTNIKRPDSTPLNSFRRIIWCPFIQEENEDSSQEEGNQTLALLHEDRAEVWDLDIVRNNHNTWPVEVTDIKGGFIVVKGHTARLSEGALSPDGTVLATASHDGYVKFWQIYIEGQDQPRCLHEWKPHDGRPLSCLLFCDNHKKQDPEVPFWRFLITGADQNRELKMWCTISWTCLQVVRFSPDPFNSSVLPGLKACLDLSAEYLILTDVQRKVLYVMELSQNQEEGQAAFSSISEFLLTHPVLSFGIQDVSRSRLRHTEVLPADEEGDSLNTEDSPEPGAKESAAGILIKLFCVHTKALQDVQIRFQPHQSLDAGAMIAPQDSQEDFMFPDHLASVTSEELGSAKGSMHGSQQDLRRIADLPLPADFMTLPTDAKPKLMTPDAFMMPSTSLQQIAVSPASSVSTLTAVTAMSSASVNDTIISRPSEELTLSPKLQLDSSLTLSSNNSSTTASGSIQSSPRNPTALFPGLPETITPKPPVQVTPGSLPMELQTLEPLVVPQASPTRERSPDVISSASTAMSQDIPEIASEILQRSFASAPPGLPVEVLDSNNHVDSMASAASALHLLSPRNRHNSEHSLHSLDMTPAVEVERLNTPSLLETAITQDNVALDSAANQPWPAAPDITRETRNSMADSPREEVPEKHNSSSSSSFHRHSYHMLQQHDSQDASAEQSDHDDEIASMASSGNFGSKGVAQRIPVKDWKSKVSPRGSPKLRRKSKKDDGELPLSPRTSDHHHHHHHHQQHLEVQEELMSLLRSQQHELSELRQNQLELMQRLTDHMDAVQSSIMGHMERVMDSQQEQEQRRLERILTDGQQRNGQLQEHLLQQLSQQLSGTLSSRLDKTLREEMKKNVSQCVSKTLEPVTGQLSNTITAKLTAVEGQLKESVCKMVKSKNITDTIGRAAADALQGPIQAAYREAFQSIVLPAFEKGCQSMFQQINASFKQGTQEYILQLEAQLKSKKAREQEARDPLLSQLQHSISTFQSTTDQLTSSITTSVRSEVQHQLHVAVGNMQESILSQVQRIIKGEVSQAMKEQQAVVTSSIMQAMRSAAGTPIPSSHIDFPSQQAHILQLMQQGHVNQAFQKALTASDLNLVRYVCETVDPQQVLGQQPCPLSQPVLLSLIQQLSADLGNRTDLKMSYLEEAMMQLDLTDSITRDHMGIVLNQLQQNLLQFMQAEPHNPLKRHARRLLLMVQGLAPSP